MTQIRNSELGMRNGSQKLPTPNSQLRTRGQASLETVFAIWGTLLLVLASMVVMWWLVQRLATRQQAYDATRVDAASWVWTPASQTPPAASTAAWNWEHNDPAEAIPLKIFNE